MMDTWEIFGRLATNDQFRQAVLAARFTGKYEVDCDGIKIGAGDYTLARDLARTVIQDRPLSLMALGELIVVLVYPRFRDGLEQLAKEISADFTIGERDWRFFVCLGAMFFDSALAADLQADATSFARYGFLAPDYPGREEDIETLQAMFDQDKFPKISNAANDACLDPWEKQCICRVLFWSEHLHPRENPLPNSAILPSRNGRGRRSR
jgi:hypothetical protein